MPKRFRVRIAAGLVFAIVVGVGCQPAYSDEFAAAAKEYPRELDRAAELGVLLKLPDIAPAPVPDAQNAEVILRDARAQLDKMDRRKVVERLQGPTFFALPPRERLRRIAPLEPILDQTVQAVDRPFLRRTRNWDTDEPWSILFPEYATERDLVKLLAVRGQIRAEMGDTRGSLRDFRAGLRLAELTPGEPVLIAGLVGVAEVVIVAQGIERALPSQSRNPEFLAGLQKIIRATKETPDFEYLLQGEAATTFAVSRYAGMEFGQDFPDSIVQVYAEDQDQADDAAKARDKERLQNISRIAPETRARAFQARTLQFWNNFFAYAKTEPDPRKRGQMLDREADLIRAANHPATILLNMLFTLYGPAGEAMVRQAATLRSLDALITALQYRNRTGKWPKDLTTAGYAKPDPFTGQPLRVRVQSNELRVYSLGANERDDGGYRHLSEERSWRTHGDTVAVYPRTPQTVDTLPKTPAPNNKVENR